MSTPAAKPDTAASPARVSWSAQSLALPTPFSLAALDPQKPTPGPVEHAQVPKAVRIGGAEPPSHLLSSAG